MGTRLDPAWFEMRDWERRAEGTVRFAVVGLGGFARDTVLPAIERATLTETGAVVSGDAEKAARLAAEHDAVGLTYDEYEEGVDADAYDAVYVATPNALHLPHAQTAADQGKDLFCEKPLESTLDRARELVEACEAADVRLFTAYRMQAEPVTRRFRELVADGFVGDPVDVHGAFSFPKGANGWRVDVDLAGGGAMMDIGIYPLNTARFVLDAEPETLDATTASPHNGFEDVDEHVSFRCTFPGGATLEGRSSFNSAAQNYFEVVGTEGRLRIEPAFSVGSSRTVTVEKDGRTTTIEGVGGDEVREEFQWLGQAILTGEELPFEGREGLRDMRLLDAVYESAESGRQIDVGKGSADTVADYLD